MVLRPYQLQAVEQARQKVRAGRTRLVVVAPTGAGKSVLIAHILASAAARGPARMLVLAHRVELVEQLSGKLDAVGLDHGVIQAGHPRVRPELAVQVASIPTLARRMDRLPPAEIVVLDEAHHVAAGSFRAVIEAYPRALLLGFTATPYRLDGKGLGDWFDDLIVVAQVGELIEAGFLVPPVVYAPSEPDVSMVQTARGDFNQRQLAAAVDRPTLVGDVVATWRRLAADRTTVVFAVGVEHSRHLVEEFRGAGVTAEHLDATTPADQRAATLARVAAGEVQVLSNVGLFTEGWDLPRISCIVKARPTQSRSLDRQMTGRGLRTWGGKRDCLVLDHAGNVYRHGLPTDPEEFSLKGVVRRAGGESVPSVRTCLMCFAVCPGGTLVCPACGEPFPVKRRPILVRKGELEPISARAAQIPQDRRAEMFARWSATAREKSYKAGYAAAVYRATFGSWPEPEVLRKAAEVGAA